MFVGCVATLAALAIFLIVIAAIPFLIIASVSKSLPPDPEELDAESRFEWYNAYDSAINRNMALVHKLLPIISEHQEDFLFSSLPNGEVLHTLFAGTDGRSAREVEGSIYARGLRADYVEGSYRWLIEPGDQLWSGFPGRRSYRVPVSCELDLPTDVKITQRILEASLCSYNCALPGERRRNRYLPVPEGEAARWTRAETSWTAKDAADREMTFFLTFYIGCPWAIPFAPEATMQTEFHGPEGTSTSVPMMRAFRVCAFREDRQASAVRVPLEQEDFGITFIVPKNDNGLESLQRSLVEGGLEDWLGTEGTGWETKTLDVRIPRFSLECHYPLIPVLKSLGLQQIFDPENPGFFPSEDGAPFWIEEITHTARTQVDENGIGQPGDDGQILADASEATGAPEFRVDRPFFFIMNRARIVVAVGRVMNPSE